MVPSLLSREIFGLTLDIGGKRYNTIVIDEIIQYNFISESNSISYVTHSNECPSRA